ncbi:MAG: hypothetical protein HZA47_12295 [Planctomycetes bacterium]|uniref:hypothetical protein n=1 Tax=Candidatus Wunengus sp. YC65 TaxID=3367701 RepID=UPI001E0481D6|nr:hypothetical protein [Planctomycetota bacterium]
MPNNAVNSDAFFVRFALYKCAGYGCRYAPPRVHVTNQNPRWGNVFPTVVEKWYLLLKYITSDLYD